MKTVKWFCKVFLAGIIAFLVLNIIFFPYYKLPTHAKNENGSTDYKWTPHSVFAIATEGYSWGRLNAEGFNNTFERTDIPEIDILITGSSNAEGFHVLQSETISAQLSGLYKGKEAVYNIGVSDHDFKICLSNFEAALEEYSPKKYAVIETQNLFIDKETLQKIIDNTVPELESNENTAIKALSSLPFLRLSYLQLSKLRAPTSDLQSSVDYTAEFKENISLYEEIIKRVASSAEKHGVKAVILFHSVVQLDENAELKPSAASEYSGLFGELCEKYGVVFVDMYKKFGTEYSEKHILPHGFANTSVGTGHLNADGNRMIAEELFERFEKEEAE